MILGKDDNEFIKSFFHEYDPFKAHLYYERTKKLKGRRNGMTSSPPNQSNKGRQNTGGSFQKKSSKTPASTRQETEARIAAYKERLTKLKEVLAKLVEAAKQRNADNAGTEESRSKKESKESKDSSESKSSSKSSGSSTEKEKADAKDYYEKNKDKISLKKQEANLKKEIKDVEQKISDAKEELKNSLQKAFNANNGNKKS